MLFGTTWIERDCVLSVCASVCARQRLLFACCTYVRVCGHVPYSRLFVCGGKRERRMHVCARAWYARVWAPGQRAIIHNTESYGIFIRGEHRRQTQPHHRCPRNRVISLALCASEFGGDVFACTRTSVRVCVPVCICVRADENIIAVSAAPLAAGRMYAE